MIILLRLLEDDKEGGIKQLFKLFLLLYESILELFSFFFSICLSFRSLVPTTIPVFIMDTLSGIGILHEKNGCYSAFYAEGRFDDKNKKHTPKDKYIY